MDLDSFLNDEKARREAFPAAEAGFFFGHAAVAPVPTVAAEAMAEFSAIALRGSQETARTTAVVAQCRDRGARLIGATPEEISLLGPTALGLSLVAKGLAWQPGDEVIYHHDDYPANVYPWLGLQGQGVRPVPLKPTRPGVITWETLEPLLTPKTRLVSLATCHFISGYRIDVDGIGRRLRERGILFCLDAIQTLGAFPLSVEHVDFLSADSHKWMLGPAGAGIFYVRDACREALQPALLGSWNVACPDFVAQETIAFEPGGRRYEPGMLNLPGIFGMNASLGLLLDFGIPRIAERLLHLRTRLVEGLRERGYTLYLDDAEADDGGADHRSAIVTFHRKGTDLHALGETLQTHHVAHSLRKNRHGHWLIRLSPHCYNTDAEVDAVLQLLGP